MPIYGKSRGEKRGRHGGAQAGTSAQGTYIQIFYDIQRLYLDESIFLQNGGDWWREREFAIFFSLSNSFFFFFLNSYLSHPLSGVGKKYEKMSHGPDENGKLNIFFCGIKFK